MKLFIQGRKETFHKLSALRKEDNVIWFHAASLGEFEQATPVIEEVKTKYSSHKILVTFFSPSGYEIRKNSDLADVICYLPFDTKGNVKKFVSTIKPEIAIIVKYEFWPNLLNELRRQDILTILVSGIFRKEQLFFKPAGNWMRKSLTAFNHFFVQDEVSKNLLKSINLNNVSVSGDTRFDRVSKILQQDNSLSFIEEFIANKHTVVAGSTWQEGETFLINYINQSEDEKFIIAPHNINSKEIKKLQNAINKRVILFSEKEGKLLNTFDVLLIDTIGLLTKIYAYADAAYVGGAFKTGLHNILEPATFGIPIVIGPQFQKFKEARDLVKLKGCISVKNQQEFSNTFSKLKTDKGFREQTGAINEEYIAKNKGATAQIIKFINKKI